MSLDPKAPDHPEDSVAVRQRLREVSQRLAELNQERRTLEDLQAALSEEARELSARRELMEQKRKQREAEARAQEQQAATVAEEVETLRCELPLLRQRHSDLLELAAARRETIKEMESRMRRFHGEVRASGAALELLHQSVARIDGKLERCRALAARAAHTNVSSRTTADRLQLGATGRCEGTLSSSSEDADPAVGERGSRA